MRNIQVLTFLTLDGVMQAPGAPEEDTSGGFRFGGWVVPFSDPVMNEVMGEQMKQPFDLLLGRRTFEIFAGHWPQREHIWPGINSATKFVASNTMTSHPWENSVFISGDVAGELAKIKAGDGPDLKVYGSGNLVQTLLKHDLVDELWLKIYPITLGSGKRLFADGTIPSSFELRDSRVSTKGVIIASFERAGEVATGSFTD